MPKMMISPFNGEDENGYLMLLRFNSFALIPFMMMGMIVRQSRDKKMGGKSLCLQTLKSPSGNSEKS